MKRRQRKHPRMVYLSRDEWGALTPREPFTKRAGAAIRSWIHHTASHFPFNPKWTVKIFKASAIKYVRQIDSYHRNVKGWNAIGYSFVVIPMHFNRVLIFEGRGWDVVGAHTEGDNSYSVGICLAGNFQTDKFDEPTQLAIRELLDRGVANGHLAGPRSNHPTGGHQDHPKAATACPGVNVQREIPELRAKVI